ncbi:MAG: hypothetical protein AMXMBFR84_34810 [Candidatus Hydrogenedentota bacterium]
MASCTRIKGLLQAYIDGELSHSDRVIVELHVSECGACGEEFRERQRMSALIFEAMSEDRLSRNLRQTVLENLPEIQPVARDIQEYNWRVKHSHDRWRRVARYSPAVAVVFLLLIAVILNSYWPREAVPSDAIGLLTGVRGVADRVAESQRASVRDSVRRNDEFSTAARSSLVMRLLGSTEVKLSAEGRMRVINSRHLHVEEGTIWLDVSPSGRLFKVSTPSGEVNVFGTMFSVAVKPDNTVVTVERGEVHVAQGDHFTILELGQQAHMSKGGGIRKTDVNAHDAHSWAHALEADASADLLFASKMQNRVAPFDEPEARPYTWEMHLAGSGAKAVTGMVLNWRPDGLTTGHCSYDLYVTDEKNNPLFKCKVNGAIFRNPERSSFNVELPNGRIEGVRWIQIRLIPDYSTGQVEMDSFTILLQT